MASEPVAPHNVSVPCVAALREGVARHRRGEPPAAFALAAEARSRPAIPLSTPN